MGSPVLCNRSNAQPRLGITEPISLGGPTDYDVIKTRELEKYLQDAGLYESQEEAVSREEVLGRLDQVVKIWAKAISRAKGLNEQLVQEANAKIFTFGSYRLGVHGPGADIDTLCVGPRHASREEDFFGELHNMLSEMPEVTELHPVPDAYVPVMRFKFNGVSIDLLYAKLSLWVVPEDLDISQDSILQNADEQTVRSLNGCRVTDQIFASGSKYSELPNDIKMYEILGKAPRRLFKLMLCAIEEGSLGLQVWDPRKYPKDRYHLMPIITRLILAMETNKADWDTLFEPYPFFEAYKNYLQIDISAENAEDLRKWKGWVESRLRQLTLKIERHTYGMLQCHPHPGDFPDKSRPFHCSYFMGLQRKQGVPANEGEQFDIRLTVDEFKHSVNVYNLWKPGMEIHVSHVKRRNLPTFVFPGGARPSRPTKVTWDSKRSSELKVSDQSQEKSHESRAAASGTDDEKKRKRADDDLDDNLRSSKSLASLPSSIREFHDDGTINTASSCSIKHDDPETNVIGGQKSEKSDLNFPEEIFSEKSEINGSGRGNVQVNPILATSDMSNSKEAENLAIEKIMSGPYNAHQTFPEEPDELEDDLEYRNQVKGDGVDGKSSSLDSLNLKAVVATDPVISNEEMIHLTHLRSGGGLEELESAEVTAPLVSGTPATVPQKKPLIRFNFTSLAKAADKST